MSNILRFDCCFLSIAFQDMAGASHVVCHDPQNRLGVITWAVVEVSDSGEYVDAIGLFWKKDMADQFAETL